LDAIKQLAQSFQSSARSSVMGSANWFGLALVILACVSMWQKPDTWVQITVFVILGAYVVIYGALYWFYSLTNPDHLRSEQHALGKMAIEKGYVGDNLLGLREVIDASPEPKSVPKNLIGPPQERGGQ
jgi:hypothetical protein